MLNNTAVCLFDDTILVFPWGKNQQKFFVFSEMGYDDVFHQQITTGHWK